jgi:DNA-directed RNA polymerase beta subunit
MDTSLKLVTPHGTDALQWGFLCTIESHDGENVGLSKHMAMGRRCGRHLPNEYPE